MLVGRNKNGTTSVLQVRLTWQEVMEKDPTLLVLARDRLTSLKEPYDSKFAIVCDDGTMRRTAFGSFTNDPQKLKAAVDTALEELRDCVKPLPHDIAQMLVSF